MVFGVMYLSIRRTVKTLDVSEQDPDVVSSCFELYQVSLFHFLPYTCSLSHTQSFNPLQSGFNCISDMHKLPLMS